MGAIEVKPSNVNAAKATQKHPLTSGRNDYKNEAKAAQKHPLTSGRDSHRNEAKATQKYPLTSGNNNILNKIKQQLDKKTAADKKWKLNFSHAIGSRTVVGARSTLNNSVSGLYRYSKELSLSASIAYIYPLGFVADSSPYNWTDISVNAVFPLIFPAKRWNGSLGLSLPTSYSSRVSTGKWVSLFGGINFMMKQKNHYTLSGSHTFYTGFYRYRTNRTKSLYNSLFSSFHSLNFNYRYKRFSFNALGRLYLLVGWRGKEAGSFLNQLRPRGGQGLGFTISYIHPKPEMSLFGSLNSNIPFISPVMTGYFPLLKISSWTYLLGLRWGV